VVDAYFLNGFRKKDALLTAGYATKAAANCNHIFNRPDVMVEIAKRRDKLLHKVDISVERVTQELADIAFFNIRKIMEIDDEGTPVYDLSKATERDWAAISAITVETYKEGRGPKAVDKERMRVTSYDKKAALDSLMRFHGAFNDKLKIDGTDEIIKLIQEGRERVGMVVEHEEVVRIEDGVGG
jgi:phage terminase small subunit